MQHFLPRSILVSRFRSLYFHEWVSNTRRFSFAQMTRVLPEAFYELF